MADSFFEGAFADEFHADDVVFGVEVEDVEFFAGAFLQADGVAEVYDHFGSGDSFGVDDLGFADEADAIAGYGDDGGFGGLLALFFRASSATKRIASWRLAAWSPRRSGIEGPTLSRRRVRQAAQTECSAYMDGGCWLSADARDRRFGKIYRSAKEAVP